MQPANQQEISSRSNFALESPCMVDLETKGFCMENIVINDPISSKEASEITGYTARHISRLCQQYQDTAGEYGLKSKKFGDGGTAPWLIERSAAEVFAKNNEGETET